MTTDTDTLELIRGLLREGIRDELMSRGLSANIVRNFDIGLAKDSSQLRLTFPANLLTLKLNDADERAFIGVFNAWADKLATASKGTFVVKAGAAHSHGLRDIECTAFSPFDLIQGINSVLGCHHQVDASLLGRGK